jgi:hypothetical protein
MTQLNPAYLVRTRNLATLSMIFWMTALNIVHLVNCEWRGVGARHTACDCDCDCVSGGTGTDGAQVSFGAIILISRPMCGAIYPRR